MFHSARVISGKILIQAYLAKQSSRRSGNRPHAQLCSFQLSSLCKTIENNPTTKNDRLCGKLWNEVLSCWFSLILPLTPFFNNVRFEPGLLDCNVLLLQCLCTKHKITKDDFVQHSFSEYCFAHADRFGLYRMQGIITAKEKKRLH